MNETQRRREALLHETRNLYRNDRIPAVHPRYRAVYRKLYNTSPSSGDGNSSTLGARIFISLVLFAIFAAADYNGENIWRYTPTQIVSEIQNQPDFSGYLKDF